MHHRGQSLVLALRQQVNCERPGSVRNGLRPSNSEPELRPRVLHSEQLRIGFECYNGKCGFISCSALFYADDEIYSDRIAEK